MKFLAYLLLVIAIILGTYTAASWWHESRILHVATADETTALGNLSSWQFADRLDEQNQREAVSNDELDIQNDRLAIQIAQLEGKSSAKARAQLTLDEQRLSSAQLSEHLSENMRELGPNEHEMKAQVAVEEAHARKIAALGSIGEDERLAYAIAALLVFSGFAFALSTRTIADVQAD